MNIPVYWWLCGKSGVIRLCNTCKRNKSNEASAAQSPHQTWANPMQRGQQCADWAPRRSER